MRGALPAILLAALVASCSATAAQENPAADGAASRLHLAAEFEREGKFEEALALYREIVASHPEHAKAVRGLKTCLLELKHYDELLAILEDEIARTPRQPALLEELGTACARKGDWAGAMRWWTQILDVQDRSRGAYSFVADLMARNRMFDEALAIYAEADSVHPGKFTRQKASLHELRFEFEEATNEYLKFLQESPTALSYVEGRLLRIGESEGGLGAVIARVERWIETRAAKRAPGERDPQGAPVDRVVYTKLLGDLYLESGDHEHARQQYFRLVDEEPGQFSALLVFGKRCQVDGEHEVAIRVFERVVGDFPNVRAVPSALLEIATSQSRLGRWDEALETYARLVADYPETDHAHTALFESGRILREGKRDPDAAETIFRQLIHAGSGPWGEADPQFEVAECAVWRGDPETAGGIYRAIRERRFSEETRERALYEEARTLFYLRKFGEADSLFKEVATQFPKGLHVNDALDFSILINTNTDTEEVMAQYAKATLELRTADPEAAAATLAALTGNHPRAFLVDESLLLLGRAQREAGDPTQALVTLERAVAEAQVMDLAAAARLLRAQILQEDLANPSAALAEYEELLVTYPETLAADRARDLSADLQRALP
jgi:tetratricopeptide (TPR) repeat protein